MTAQLKLFADEPRTATGVIHIITPDMATLCREDYLTASDRGDRCAISPHHDDRDRVEHRNPDGSWRCVKWARVRWRNITCVWCRSLGHTYYRHICRQMQQRQAA